MKPCPAPSASFSVNKVSGCLPLTVHFYPEVIKDSIIYLWEFGDGSFSNEKTPVHQYNNTGTYSVSLTTKYILGSKQSQTIKNNLISVIAQPKANFTYKIYQDKIRINNLSTSFEQCQWFVDSFFESNDETPQFILEKGKHNITLVLKNKGCTDSINKTVTITPVIRMFLPTAFTPDGNGQNDIFKPVFNNLPDSYKILIFDKLGKIVFVSEDPTKGWDGKINGLLPQKGIYMWNIVYQQKNNKPVEKSGQVKLIVK